MGDRRRPEETRGARAACGTWCGSCAMPRAELPHAEAAECGSCAMAPASCGMPRAECRVQKLRNGARVVRKVRKPPRACQDRHGHAAACSDRQGCAAASPHRTAVAACPPAPSRVQGAGRAGGAGRCMLPHSYHSSRWKSAQGAGRRAQGAAMLPHSYHSSRWKSAQNLQFCRESPGGGPSAGPPR